MSSTTSDNSTKTAQPQESQTKFWKRRAVKPKANPIFDNLLWRLQTRQQTEPSLAIGVSGASAGAGATTVAAGLAIRAAEQQDDRVLLIDAHGSWGGLLETFHLSNGPGLSEILAGTMSLHDYEPVHLLDNLDLMRAGNSSRSGSLRLHQHLVEEVLAHLGQRYSMVVVDLPPIDKLRAATALATQLSGVLLVVRSESVKKTEVTRAVHRMRVDGINLWGTVLNRKIEYVPAWIRRFV